MLKLSKENEMKLERTTESLREYQAVERSDIEGNGEIVE